MNLAEKSKANRKQWSLELVQQEALKYQTRNNFQTGSSSAYQSARRNGWLDEVCSHMERPERLSEPSKWTFAAIRQEALKYETRSKFKNKSASAYNAASKNGWLNEACTHMERPNKSIKWTSEAVEQEALKFKTRNEFRKGSRNAYAVARRNGWLDTVCNHMSKPERLRKWTKEAVQTEALKYATRKEFTENARSAQQAAQKNGWLDEVCGHMHRPERVLKWTFEAVHREALRFETRSAFSKGSLNAYTAARRGGWLDEVCSHMKQLRIDWTKDLVQAEALKYESRGEFGRAAKGAYEYALKNGFLDDVCSHMKPFGTHLDKESCTEKALQYGTRSAFMRGSKQAYNSARKNGWLDEVCSHMKPERIRWTKELVQAEALKYETRYEFTKGSLNAYTAASRNGWLNEVCTHMKPKLLKWTIEMVQTEALKYETRTEFQKEASSCYQTARRNGWLDEVCSHMKSAYGADNPNRYKGKWSLELLQQEALKYKSRGEFAIGSQGAYNAARRRGWLDKVCAHMPSRAPETKPRKPYRSKYMSDD